MKEAVDGLKERSIISSMTLYSQGLYELLKEAEPTTYVSAVTIRFANCTCVVRCSSDRWASEAYFVCVCVFVFVRMCAFVSVHSAAYCWAFFVQTKYWTGEVWQFVCVWVCHREMCPCSCPPCSLAGSGLERETTAQGFKRQRVAGYAAKRFVLRPWSIWTLAFKLSLKPIGHLKRPTACLQI